MKKKKDIKMTRNEIMHVVFWVVVDILFALGFFYKGFPVLALVTLGLCLFTVFVYTSDDYIEYYRNRRK